MDTEIKVSMINIVFSNINSDVDAQFNLDTDLQLNVVKELGHGNRLESRDYVVEIYREFDFSSLGSNEPALILTVEQLQKIMIAAIGSPTN